MEAGQAVRLGPWAELRALAEPVRRAVFIEEQQCPEDEEWDEADAESLHAVILDASGAALATGRLLPVLGSDAGADAGLGRIGRMAVARSARGGGLGGRILDVLMAQSQARGDRGVLLHAQCHAQGFYAGRGFVPRGEPFDEVGIPHIEMVMAFPA